MRAKVSVVIPVYNAEKTLRRTVESLIYGEERNIEIILVDDCSIDNSWHICKELELEFENVVYIRNNENKGVSYTRNRGMLKSRAPYIMFVDSDDWVSRHYISMMLDAAEKYMDCQIICGFYYIDCLKNSQTSYIWEKEETQNYIEIQGEKLFEAVNKIMLQSSCNKIFKREIIETKGIRFDETQSMGEDFEFVLDYMLAANIKKCMMINEPLYYYVRVNQSSLMSNFGWVSNEREPKRLKKLVELSGNMRDISEKLKAIQIQINNNWVYHVVRTKGKTKKEKLERIEQIWNDGNSKKYYRKQMYIYYKEQILNLVLQGTKFIKRVEDWLMRKRRDKKICKMHEKLEVSEFTIISQNCIGGVLYSDMNIEFLSPTINLYFSAEDFVKFVLNLKKYIEIPLQIEWKESWPIGRLNDVTIEFMHYKNCKEAFEAWERRKKRIMLDNILILSTDMEGFDEAVFKEWQKIEYPKILLTAKKCFKDSQDVIYFSKYSKNGSVIDLIPKREFYKEKKLIMKINEIGK